VSCSSETLRLFAWTKPCATGFCDRAPGFPMSKPCHFHPHNQITTPDSAAARLPNHHESIRWHLSASDKCRAQSSCIFQTFIRLAQSCRFPCHAVLIMCKPQWGPTYPSTRLPSLPLLRNAKQRFHSSNLYFLIVLLLLESRLSIL
jgi:hypothetical protein